MADQRPYIGYEDYSPEGRAAIDAFNKAQGPNYLRQTDSLTAYTKAKDAAMKAALAKALANQLFGSVESMQGYDGVPTGSTTGIQPTYQYPPK